MADSVSREDTYLFRAAAFARRGGMAEVEEALQVLGERTATALVERLDSLCFLLTDNVSLIDWEGGRAFGPDAELRWRREGDAWHILLIIDEPVLVPNGFTPLARLTVEEIVRYCLWGQRDGNAYRENRLPDDLHYPIAGGVRLMLEAVLYCVEEETLPSLVRYRALVPEESTAENG